MDAMTVTRRATNTGHLLHSCFSYYFFLLSLFPSRLHDSVLFFSPFLFFMTRQQGQRFAVIGSCHFAGVQDGQPRLIELALI